MKKVKSNREGSKKIGLTLGKFAPLHQGHQFMMETAIHEMDEVIVIIYDSPETINIPLPVRARWIRTLYPTVEVIEGWDGPLDIGDTPEIKQKQENYILGLLKGRKITHFYSSEFYGDHMSKALGAIDRRVDESREKYPISGTEVREDPYLKRNYVAPVVYADFITKVVFLGAPSTGKSTIAHQLAEEFQTVWMPEYGREYWEEHQVDRRLTKEQLVDLANGHIEREQQKIMKAKEYLFVDTNAITTYLFSQDYHGESHQELIQLADEASTGYDLVFLCEDDIPYEDTWDRSGAVHRSIFQKKIRADLLERKIPYFSLKGTLIQRIEKVKKVLQRFQKYDSLGRLFM
ncbi:AAA family ATPase [Shimazuella kribbensis]|uniref:AAA family ATPase n=1 Tax=Shimazuella kribbensis TaxID=139808 RepID=UPI00041E902E|nr:AAA family ATPase [Shimazuella kribbensis]